MTLAAGATMTITYGSGAPGATAPATAGAATWQAKSKAVGRRADEPRASPSITVAQPPASARTFPAAAGLYGTASWTAGCATRRALRHGDRQLRRRAPEGRALDPPGRGNYWNGSASRARRRCSSLATGTSSWSYGFPAASFPADGAYTVQTRATDNLNGVETPTSTTFTIDPTPPGAFSLTAPAAGFVGPSATVSATAVDTGGSGIAQLEFRYCAGGICSFAAGTTIGAAGRDVGLRLATVGSLGSHGRRAVHGRRAGDGCGRQHDRLRTDDRDPRHVRADDDRRRAIRLAVLDVTVTLSPGDCSGSGVASTSYRVDGAGWHTGTSVVISAPADHSNDGSHTIDYASVDNVGNAEAVQHATVTIDTQAPSGYTARPGLGARPAPSPSPTRRRATPAPASRRSRSSTRRTARNLDDDRHARLAAPWSVAFDTTTVADGQYDLRELISDAAAPANVTTINLTGPEGDRQHARRAPPR